MNDCVAVSPQFSHARFARLLFAGSRIREPAEKLGEALKI